MGVLDAIFAREGKRRIWEHMLKSLDWARTTKHGLTPNELIGDWVDEDGWLYHLETDKDDNPYLKSYNFRAEEWALIRRHKEEEFKCPLCGLTVCKNCASPYCPECGHDVNANISYGDDW